VNSVVVVMRAAPSGEKFPDVACKNQEVADAHIRDILQISPYTQASDFETVEISYLEQ